LLQSVGKYATKGLGYPEEIPSYRLDPRNKIPSKIQLPSDEEIIQFLKIYKGISPYDPSSEWYKKMFNWDLYTH